MIYTLLPDCVIHELVTFREVGPEYYLLVAWTCKHEHTFCRLDIGIFIVCLLPEFADIESIQSPYGASVLDRACRK